MYVMSRGIAEAELVGVGKVPCCANHNSGTTADADQAWLNMYLLCIKESLCLAVRQVFHLWHCRLLRYVMDSTCNQMTFFNLLIHQN